MNYEDRQELINILEKYKLCIDEAKKNDDVKTYNRYRNSANIISNDLRIAFDNEINKDKKWIVQCFVFTAIFTPKEEMDSFIKELETPYEGESAQPLNVIDLAFLDSMSNNLVGLINDFDFELHKQDIFIIDNDEIIYILNHQDYAEARELGHTFHTHL